MKSLITLSFFFCTWAATAQILPPTDSALVGQGWQLLLERNDHQYWLWDENMEWEPARAMCESLGAYLYWPNDAEEHQAVWETLPHGVDENHFWTAIHQDFNVVPCNDSNGGWAGPNNESQTFFLWSSGEPNNSGGKESVVQFEWSDDGIGWNDAPGQSCDEGNDCECRFSQVILERSKPGFCGDPKACNFFEGSLSNDECDYSCCPGPGCCADGMHWDWELEQCQNTLPGDINSDGCVQLNDLLDVLSAYGNCSETVLFTCSDPVLYEGFEYATVQIGEQCWFADNLRSTKYANGDEIPTGLNDVEWSNTNDGAVAIYGAGTSACDDFSPNGDACNPDWSLNSYGRLYNWYAVQDSRGICPNGWHVPSDAEWMLLEVAIGMGESVVNLEGWRGTDEGSKLKSEEGWFNLGNGNNDFGFSAVPSGHRWESGEYYNAGTDERWWSSTGDQASAWHRDLSYDRGDIDRDFDGHRYGLSVRCVQDNE